MNLLNYLLIFYFLWNCTVNVSKLLRLQTADLYHLLEAQ